MNLEQLETLLNAIEGIERSIAYQKAEVKAWHESKHDTKRRPFFDLYEAENLIDADTVRVIRLKRMFNENLETLKYEL